MHAAVLQPRHAVATLFSDPEVGRGDAVTFLDACNTASLMGRGGWARPLHYRGRGGAGEEASEQDACA